jgi:hypothetical protein
VSETPLYVRAMLSLKGEEYRVWAYLHWRQGANESSWPKQEKIASDLGLTAEGVRKIMARLEAKGWVRILRPSHTAPGTKTEYQVTEPENTPTTVGVNTPTDVGAKGENHPNGHTSITPMAGGVNTPTAVPQHKEEHYQGTLPGNNTPPVVPQGTGGRDVLFERFWEAYPRKVGKDAARRAFAKRKPDTALLAKMLDAIETQMESQTPEERTAIATLLDGEMPKAPMLDSSREEKMAFRAMLQTKINDLLRSMRNGTGQAARVVPAPNKGNTDGKKRARIEDILYDKLLDPVAGSV